MKIFLNFLRVKNIIWMDLKSNSQMPYPLKYFIGRKFGVRNKFFSSFAKYGSYSSFFNHYHVMLTLQVFFNASIK